MPVVDADFNRTCVRLELDPARSGAITHAALTLHCSAGDLRAFNQCAQRVAPGAPVLGAGQIAAAARWLARAAAAGNPSCFIQIRMRRAGEVRALLADPAWTIDPALLGRMQCLMAYLDGPVALVPVDAPGVGGLDRALLVDMAMASLRPELDEYADFCRCRASEAARLGLPIALVDIDRGRWARARSAEVHLQRMVRHGSASHAAPGGPVEVFRVV